MEMGAGVQFREEIVVHASGSKAFIALLNENWAESKECRYEFNIATRSNLSKGFPVIIPVVLKQFDWNKYPLLLGTMANTNALFYEESQPSKTWEQVKAALISNGITANPNKKEVVEIPKEIVSELPKDVSAWTMTHVNAWLKSLPLPGLQEPFAKNWVDGTALLELTELDLVESLGFTKVQARRLNRELINVKTKHKKGELVDLKSGFKTGLWIGYYHYSTTDGRGKGETSMDVTMTGGVVAGYGTDSVGDFLIQGMYNETTKEIRWDKQYVGAHLIRYQGKLKTDKIAGDWSYSDGTHGGTFELAKPK